MIRRPQGGAPPPYDPKDRAVPDRPEIVCLCGSLRFTDELHAANRDLTLAGAIVVAPSDLTVPG